MRFVLAGLILFAIGLLGFVVWYTTPIADPPGWQEHHERLRSGMTPEEIEFHVFGLDHSDVEAP